MKHYTTIFFCLVLSAILIFVPSTKAASMTATYSIQSQVYATLINVYYPELDETGNPVGNEVIATYEYSVSPSMSFSSYDGYINGTSTAVFTIYPTGPAGGTRCGVTANFNGIQSDTIYSASSSSSGANLSQAQINITTYFANHVAFSATQRMNSIYGTCSYRFQYTGSNAPDPDPYLTVNCVVSNSYGNLALSVDPLSSGMPEIIASGIIDALNDQSMPFNSILSTLEGIRTQDQTNYTTIIAYLADNDTFNSTLYTWLTTVLEDNFTDLLDDTTYISSVLNAARNLINAMNNRDNLYYPIFEAALDLANTRLQTLINLMSETPAEAASMENAINQMESKQAAINDYSLPAAGNIMGNANSYVNQGSAGMNLLATIVNQPLYILILMTVISLAFVSYLLYGKGV